MNGVGILTGFEPFAGLAENPAMEVLPYLEGAHFSGIAIKTFVAPVTLKSLASFLPDLIKEHQPAFVVSLGVAIGAPILRVETIGTNTLNFGVPDNDGQRHDGNVPIDETGPAARNATWDHGAIVQALLENDLPAVASSSAGTHMCNATLYTGLGAMERLGLNGPCGFFHLPLLPSQVARSLRESLKSGGTAPAGERMQACMSLKDQLRGVTIMLEVVARQACG